MRTDDEIRAALAARPFPANPWVRLTDEAVLIQAGYTDTLERLLRWVPKARWRADLRCWHVPLAGAELVRAILPEISRLAEAMQDMPSPPSADVPGPRESAAEAQARALFRDAARLLYGSDWQRDTARALGRDEAALACWLVGEGVAEAPPDQLLAEMLALMQRRATEIVAATDVLAGRLAQRRQA
ncbi:hypothetical protein [Aquabacterium sp.]|uniref:hypothetical protein n=1 Tax=Aquabacterium sp. TaxID=1872578 RepID=UPI0025B854AF|nr:hypothetical protein [Aquabacterium sp.]